MDAAGRAHEIFEQRELPHRELDLFAGAADFARREIEDEVLVLQQAQALAESRPPYRAHRAMSSATENGFVR